MFVRLVGGLPGPDKFGYLAGDGRRLVFLGEVFAGHSVQVGQPGRGQPGEVLVSSTVMDLVTGSGIEFDDRGEHTLKGIAGSWRLYSVRAA